MKRSIGQITLIASKKGKLTGKGIKKSTLHKLKISKLTLDPLKTLNI
jgi:hypothetical protein